MPESPKKILFLLTRPPYPANDGTKLKILTNILDAFRKGYVCTIAIVSDVPPDPASIAYLEERYGHVRYFYRSRFRRALSGLWYWLMGYPLQTGFFYSSSTARALRDDFSQADVVYAHTLRFGRYLEKLPSEAQRKVLFDFNDAISFNYRNATHYASGWWRMIYAMEAPRVARYERKMLALPFTFSIVSEADKRYLGDPRIHVIGHGVPDDLLAIPDQHQGDLGAVFMGNMTYPPNLDAIGWLAGFLGRHAFPSERTPFLDAVGRHPEGTPARFPGIAFKGFVDDVYGFVVQHKVFLAPLRFGAGVQTKVLEAMALGMPVITSPVGARGIDGVEHGENIFVVDLADEDAWTKTVMDLLGDPALRARIGGAAREFIHAHNTASRAQAAVRGLVEGIVAPV